MLPIPDQRCPPMDEIGVEAQCKAAATQLGRGFFKNPKKCKFSRGRAWPCVRGRASASTRAPTCALKVGGDQIMIIKCPSGSNI